MAPPSVPIPSVSQPLSQETSVAHSAVATKRSRRPLYIASAVVLALLAGGVTAGVIVKANQDNQATIAQASAVAAEKEADKLASEQAAIEASDAAERASREETVTEIEASVKKLAEENVAEGALDGPVLSASCDPVSGTTDVLTDLTTTFSCFVATDDNGDGTFSGYYFNATINWSTGSYTYGLGQAS